MQPDVILAGYLCNVRLTMLTRHPDGFLSDARQIRTAARYDLGILDSIWAYAVENEDVVTVIVMLRLPGDEGFEFSMAGATATSADFLRLREYLEGSGMTEVESHILAERIVEAVVSISAADGAAESEVADAA